MTAQPSPLLAVENLNLITENIRLVHDLSFTITAGERVGMIGESGAGKTLTALAVLGLLPSQIRAEGKICWDQTELVAAPESVRQTLRGSEMSMVFQEPLPALNPLMPVGKQIGEMLSQARGRDRTQAKEEAIEWLERVGIERPEHRYREFPHQFSGGQLQRIMIAIALAAVPQLVIADEPTTSLDTITAHHILDLLSDLCRQYGSALWLITHDLSVVERMCERALVIQSGKLVEEASINKLLTQPQHSHSQTLITAHRELCSLPARLTFPPAADEEAGPPVLADPVLVEASALSHRFRRFGRSRSQDLKPALDRIELKITEGSRLGIVGESGAGKSTLARLLVGLEPLQTGYLRVGETVVSAAKHKNLVELRRLAQMIFQDPQTSLDPRLRVGPTIAAPLGGLKIGGDHQQRTQEMLQAVGLDPQFSQRYVHQLSGGERQRVAIARALVPHPRLLIADEPVSSLDPSRRGEILELLRGLQADYGLTLVFISHDIAAVAQICSEIVVMQQGAIVEYGSLAQVLSEPSLPYTRQLLSASLPIRM